MNNKKMGIIQSFALLCLTAISTELQAFDAVICGTEHPSFRQLCKIDGIDHSQDFSLAGKSEYRGYKFDVASILKNPKIDFEGPESIISLDLLGLQPILEFYSNFTNLDACRQSTLWKDRIAVYLRLSDSSEALASDVIVGAKHHLVDLTLSGQSGSAKYAIKTADDGSQVSIETRFFLKNLDDFPGRSVSLKRIPPACKLDIFNQQVTFDPVDINAVMPLYA